MVYRLSQLRHAYPNLKTLAMDEETLNVCSSIVSTADVTPPALPQNLTQNEQVLFKKLAHSNLRLEQERIPHIYIIERLNDILE